MAAPIERQVEGALSRPRAAESLLLASVTYSWSAGAWGGCSVSCGSGLQIRTVQCLDNTSAVVADSFCTDPKPATVQSCNPGACVTYSWVPAAWSSCSATCGPGAETRTVQCRNNSNVVVADVNCTTAKPATVQSCNLGACPTYSWVTGAFGSCSVTCGTGTQVRSVSCQNDLTMAVVASSFCTSGMPASSQSCTIDPCGPCDAQPRPTCDTPEKSSFTYARSSAKPEKRSLQVKLTKSSPAREVSELGDPTASTTETLCIYGNGTLLDWVSIPAGAGEPGWEAKSGKTFKYRNRDSQAVGAASIQAGAPGDPALPKVLVKAKGADVIDLGLPLSEPVTVQLVNDANPNCVGDSWPSARVNDATDEKYKASNR